METRKDDGTYIDPALAKMILAEFWPRFMESSPDLRPSTIRLYEMLYRRFLRPFFGARSFGSTTPLDVRRFVAQIDANPATAAAAFRLLRRVCSAAMEADIIGRNPTRGIKPPATGTEEMRFLSAPEVARLASAIDEQYETLVYLLAYGGLRIGEAAALRVGDLDLLRGRIQIVRAVSEVGGKLIEGKTKTGATRSVSLPSFLRDQLSRHVESFPPGTDGLVFGSPTGGPFRLRNFRARVFGPAVRAAGLEPLRVHDLRHTCAALLIEQGAPIKAVADRLGHSSPVVTLKTYAHVLPGLADQLNERLDATFRAASDAAAAPLPPRGAKVASIGERAESGKGL